jgi:hypothetical protein
LGGYHGQSGDDGIIFCEEDLGNTLRLLYRIFEMEPSETTWYSSQEYATFTEEACLYSEEKAWQYVDSPKPRGFSCSETGADGCPVLGKIAMLGKYVSYEPDGSELRKTVCQLIDRMLVRNTMLKQELNRKNNRPRISKHLPPGLGGLGHPRAQEDLWGVLTDEEKRILIKWDDECSIDSLIESYGGDRGVTGDKIRDHLYTFIQSLNIDVDVISGAWISANVANCMRIKQHQQYASAEGMIPIQDCFRKMVRQITFLESLTGSPVQRDRGQVRRLKQKYKTLVDDSKEVEIPEVCPFRNLKGVMGSGTRKRADYYISKTLFEDYIKGLQLPSMNVEFVEVTGG